MTIEEAFLYSEQNQASIRHKSFLPEEYIIVKETHIVTEDGFIMIHKQDCNYCSKKKF